MIVKDILFSMGFGHVWIAQGFANKSAFMSLCKQRSTDLELQLFAESMSRAYQWAFVVLVVRFRVRGAFLEFILELELHF